MSGRDNKGRGTSEEGGWLTKLENQALQRGWDLNYGSTTQKCKRGRRHS